MSDMDDMDTEPCAPSPHDLLDLSEFVEAEFVVEVVLSDLLAPHPPEFFAPPVVIP